MDQIRGYPRRIFRQVITVETAVRVPLYAKHEHHEKFSMP